jgi:hypothetical protein
MIFGEAVASGANSGTCDTVLRELDSIELTSIRRQNKTMTFRNRYLDLSSMLNGIANIKKE